MQNKQNILITTSSFGKTDSKPLNTLQSKGFKVIMNPYGRKLTEPELILLITQYKPTAIIAGVEPITANVLTSASGFLKTIARCGIGLDSVDIDAARKLNITVTNTPDAPTIPVAELTVGMIIGLLRKLHISDTSIRKKQWERPMGTLLFRKTVGIIGCGRIGCQLAHLLQGFQCKILGSDLIANQNELFELVDTQFLLSQSDIVTLHIPYNIGNHHFINKSRLELMKQNALLVNTSRGGLVDEKALFNWLTTRTTAGAALDCFETEPYDGPLKELSNTLLTAHIGSYATEGRIAMENQAAENLLAELCKIEKGKQ
ncbi:MAG: phosphoglycerate dehydrogenase [Desulfamplus sp.]|nr:phosphoglycerate dehydrogenase [Desulfamplus sp.]